MSLSRGSFELGQVVGDMIIRYDGVCKTHEEWIDEYTIGSEGGSAWAWRGPSPEAMHSLGFTGKTRQEAVERVLEAIWKGEKDEGKV